MATAPSTLGPAFTSAISTAIAAIPAAGTPEDAYKAFMDTLGKGFLDSVGNAIGAAVGAINKLHTTSPNPNYSLIIDQLMKGSIVQLTFPTPLKTAVSQNTGVTSSLLPTPTGTAGALGGSVSVGGSWGF